MILKINGITKRYKDKIAVDNFSVDLEKGVYGLLGPNGAGKTTLMRIIVDILKPTSGKLFYNGKNKDELDEKYREVLGYLPQDIGFYKTFSAEKYLYYIGALKGMEKSKVVEKTDELLEMVNLIAVRKKKISKFSGGMKRRLGIAQALLNDPEILILDEPTAGLDPKERIKFRNIISKISEDRIVILSTHIVSDIDFIAKEVMLMKDGKLVAKDNREKLIEKIKDKVWKVKIPQRKLEYYEDNFSISNVSKEEDEIKLTIVSDKKPSEEAKQSVGGLEEVYLYYFDEKVGENIGNIKI